MQLRVLHNYLRKKLGYAAQKNTKLYDLVCRALAKDGFIKPLPENSKKWVLKHYHIIQAVPRVPKTYLIKKVPSPAEYKNLTSIATSPKRPYKFAEPPIVRIIKANIVQSNDFLQSFEWRKLRMEALIKYGRKCACCGASPETGAIMNVDHIKPRKTHPELALDLNNLQVLCHECNHGKGNWNTTDWRK